MSDRIPMTPNGYQSLKDELHQLKTVERHKIVKEIEIARAHGDISENAEFHAAKERQSHIEGRVAMLEDKLARAQVIESPTGEEADAVRFGTTVVLVDIDTDEEVSYRLVGEDEADVRKGMISVTSPVARALLGKGEGDVATVRAPKGTRELEIRAIRFD